MAYRRSPALRDQLLAELRARASATTTMELLEATKDAGSCYYANVYNNLRGLERQGLVETIQDGTGRLLWSAHPDQSALNEAKALEEAWALPTYDRPDAP